MSSPQPVITVFGSARVQPASVAYQQAAELGEGIARRGWTLCNGGYGGTMEAAARGARAAGGHTIGVTLADEPTRTANPWVAEERSAVDPLARLAELVRCGDAYVVLGGGTGTLLELAAVWELRNKRRIAARREIVVVGPHWDGAIADVVRADGSAEPPHIVGSVKETLNILQMTIRVVS